MTKTKKSDPASRLAELDRADARRGSKSAAEPPAEPAPRLTTIGVPIALRDRLRDLAHERTKAAGRKVTPYQIIAEALDRSGM